MRRKRRLSLCLTAIAIAVIAFVSVADFNPKLVWNGSQSAPQGLYLIRGQAPELNHYVLVNPPPATKDFIVTRAYLPPGTPLIKRIAGLSGDEICREGTAVFINETYAAEALLTDGSGRPMPRWDGCFKLQTDEVFLLNHHENSFDGRYFGAIKRWHVMGIAVPIWVVE